MTLKKQILSFSSLQFNSKKILIPISLFLLSAFYLVYFCKFNFKIADEGIPLNGALRMLRGETPWVDFYGYAPGRYMFYSRLFEWFGEDLMVPRRAIALLTAMTTTLIYIACRYIMSVPFALAAALLYLAAPGVYYGRYIAIFFSIAALVSVTYLRGNRFAPFLLGLIVGVTYLFRPDIGYVFIFLSFLLFGANQFLYQRDLRSATISFMWSLVGASVVIIPLFVAIVEKGLLEKMITIQNRFFIGGYQTLMLPFPKWSWSTPDEFFLFYIPILIYLGTAYYLFRRFRSSQIKTPDIFVLFLLLAGLGLFNQALWRTQPENIMKIIAPTIMLICFFAQKNFSSQTGKKAKVICVGILLIPAFFYIKVMNTKYAFFLGSTGRSTQEFKLMKTERGKVFAKKEHANLFTKMVFYIQKTTEPEDTIFIVPFMGHPLYFLANRKNPSFYEWILPPEAAIIPNLDKEIIAELELAQTPLIIYYDFALDNKEERRFKNYAPELHRYIHENYYLDMTIGNYWMLKRGKPNFAALQRQTNSATEKVRKGLIWGQTFFSKMKYLSEIRVRVSTRALKINGGLVLHLTSKEKPRKDIRTSYRTFHDSIMDEWLSFKFQPIKESMGKKYYFYLSPPDDPTISPISLGVFKKDNYRKGHLVRNGIPQKGDLSFVALASRG